MLQCCQVSLNEYGWLVTFLYHQIKLLVCLLKCEQPEADPGEFEGGSAANSAKFDAVVEILDSFSVIGQCLLSVSADCLPTIHPVVGYHG